MKVMNELMCRAMVGVVSGQTKITRRLKKLGKIDELKDLDELEGPEWREYIFLIGDNWDLLGKAE